MKLIGLKLKRELKDIYNARLVSSIFTIKQNKNIKGIDNGKKW
jgi:hypothetical protein